MLPDNINLTVMWLGAILLNAGAAERSAEMPLLEHTSNPVLNSRVWPAVERRALHYHSPQQAQAAPPDNTFLQASFWVPDILLDYQIRETQQLKSWPWASSSMGASPLPTQTPWADNMQNKSEASLLSPIPFLRRRGRLVLGDRKNTIKAKTNTKANATLHASACIQLACHRTPSSAKPSVFLYTGSVIRHCKGTKIRRFAENAPKCNYFNRI